MPHVPIIKCHGLHSLRSGGTKMAANRDIPDRMSKHGRWRSEGAKDGCVKINWKILFLWIFEFPLFVSSVGAPYSMPVCCSCVYNFQHFYVTNMFYQSVLYVSCVYIVQMTCSPKWRDKAKSRKRHRWPPCEDHYFVVSHVFLYQ